MSFACILLVVGADADIMPIN